MKKLKIKKITLIICLLSLGSSMALAAISSQNFNVFGKVVSFDLPDDWKTINKKIGVPLKMMGPMYKGRRPVITFVPIDMKNEKIELEDATKALDSYKLSRLSWLQKFNGSALKFNPIKVYKANSSEITQFGYMYTFNEVNYEEKSYYINCKNNTYHLKTLVQVEHGKKWNRLVSQIADSFKCN